MASTNRCFEARSRSRGGPSQSAQDGAAARRSSTAAMMAGCSILHQKIVLLARRMATVATTLLVDLASLAGSWWPAKEPHHALCRRSRECARWLYLLGRCFERTRGLRFRAEWRDRLRAHRAA